jgi:hypothetical protein
VRDPHDFSGVWLNATVDTILHPDEGAREDGLLPFNREGEKIFYYRIKSNFDGKTVADSSLYCRPFSLPRIIALPAPLQMIQDQSHLWQFYQDRVRTISLNAEHPKDLKPSYTGHSIGRWEGNTLVIDTIGISGKTTWMDHGGSPASNKLHVVERWTKAADGSYIDNVVTFDDPVYYTRPFTVKLKYMWHSDMTLGDGHCEDNPRLTIYKGIMYNGEKPPRE